MPVEQVQLSPVALIVGCGFVGRFLAAKLVAKNHRVFAVVRSEASARALAPLGVHSLLAPVTQRLSLAATLRPVLAGEPFDLYHLIPPGRPRPNSGDPSPREVVIDGAANLLSLLAASRVRRLVVASSTGVYGQTDGEYVDADAVPQPHDERGQLLLEAERIWLDSRRDAHIVRFAGLYGPGRIIGLQAVRDGAPLVGDPQAWLNLIHGEDAAELMIAMMTASTTGRIELGSDGSPVRRIEYYSTLAKSIGAPEPRVLAAAEAASELGLPREPLQRASSKRCDNVRTCQRTGWLPRYPHFRDGLAASFAAMRQ